MGKKFVENYEKMSDNELIERINSGEYELLAVLLNRYYPMIIYYISKYCPENLREDGIQEANLALYSAAKSFDGAKASFSTFAALCIKRSVFNLLESRCRKKDIPDELVTSIDELEIVDCNSPEKIFFEREEYKALTDSIELKLSGMEYKVLQLYLAGESYADIGEKLSVSQKAVDNALLRIRKKLKK